MYRITDEAVKRKSCRKDIQERLCVTWAQCEEHCDCHRKRWGAITGIKESTLLELRKIFRNQRVRTLVLILCKICLLRIVKKDREDIENANF